VTCGDSAWAATVAKQSPEPLESVRAAIRTKQFEHAVGVTKDGVEIFTLSPRGFERPPYPAP